MPPDPARLVERFYIDLWHHPDPDLAAQLLDPGFAFTSAFAAPRHGTAAYLDYIHAVHAALGDYRCTIDDLVTAQDRAAARLRFTATHRGDFFGVAATGREIAWTGAAFFHLAGARLGSLWVVGDMDAVKRQLGADAPARFDRPSGG